MSEAVDLFTAQGMAAGMIYDYVPDPPWGPPHRCPGCQPRPDDSALAKLWERWRALDDRLRKIGESSSCPIVRGETLPESYTNEERLARGGVETNRLPKYVAPTIAPVVSADVALLVVEAPIVVTSGPVKAKRKTPVKRAAKAPKTPEEQGDLF